MTARPDEIEDELRSMEVVREEDLTAIADDLPKPRRSRTYHACYACVDVGRRPLTRAEEHALRTVATALLDAQAWLGWLNGWLALSDGTVLERLEFRTQPPRPAEGLSYVEVTVPAGKRSRKR